MKKKRPVLLIVIALNLVALIALAFAYPHLMVSPGPLVKGHEELATDCFACHAAWRGASTQRSRKPFSHALLVASVREQCSSCHVAPKDTMHRFVQAECSQCHASQAWKPATFDHTRFFVLDRDHNAACETCHQNHDYSRYTCYGCHEHSQAKVRAKHLKEGIRDFQNCVECHRDPGVEPKEHGGRERGRRERD